MDPAAPQPDSVPRPDPALQPPQPQSTPVTPQPQGPKTNGMAIIALVLAFFVPIVGLILGFIAKSQIKKKGEGGNGLATAAIIVSIVVIVLNILILAIVFGAAILSSNSTNSTTSTATNTNTATNTTKYQGDEAKAADSAERFLEGLRDSDFNKSYNQMGPELKKEAGSASSFASELKSKNLNLIKSWNITSVTSKTNASGATEITVKGTVKVNASNGNGTFEFGFYKDTDGSVNMLSYQIQPN